jgi:DNA polymerase I
MKFQILDVDYVLINEKPVVRLFGKNEKGEVVCGFCEDYLPYFYVKCDEMPESLKNDPLVVKIEKVKRFLPVGYQTKPEEVYKITLKNPAKTPEVREKIRSDKVILFEADILFKYRFMNDFDLKSFDWIEAGEENNVSTNSVQAQKKIKISRFKTIEKTDDAPLRYLSFDIECVSLKEGVMPDQKKDPIIMISVVFSEPYRGKKSMVLSTRADIDVTPFESEKEMLNGFIDIIKGYDPDILSGYNINNFDIPYILERMKQNSIAPVFGRCERKYVVSNKLTNKHKTNIAGRIVVDSFEIVKKDFSLKRYGLDFVAKELLNEEKEDIKKSKIEKFWNGNQDQFRSLVKYCKKDSELALNLVLKLKLLDKYVALSKISGILLQDILDSGETTRIENFILREFNKEGYILPCRPEQKYVSVREKARIIELKGGFVLQPKKGIHSSVAVLDFKSMYPSLIITYNICPTTLIVENGAENPIESPSGAKFVPREIRQGIIPKILQHLMDERQKIKKTMKQEANENIKRSLYARQWALKIMANAFYGQFGYSRAKIYNLDVANSITSFGRDTIQKTKDIIERDFGYEVVYGDTDSVMVKVPAEELEEIAKIGRDVSSSITKRLAGIMELEFEKVFKRFLPLTKKRYAAWCFEASKDGWKESIEMKGIETVRRDWCDLVSEAMSDVIEIILKKNDIKATVEYFKNVVDDLINGKIPIQKLVITKTMTKRPELYVGMQPHAELVKKVKIRSPAEAPGIGDRIGYVIVKGTQLLSKRAEDPLYVIEKGLEIDPQYYIENQLLPPLERIFTALDISKSELLGKGRQMQLLKAINNEKRVNEALLFDIDGFICNKCNKFYRRPPLVGSCECGGYLLFSSNHGPVEYANL